MVLISSVSFAPIELLPLCFQSQLGRAFLVRQRLTTSYLNFIDTLFRLHVLHLYLDYTCCTFILTSSLLPTLLSLCCTTDLPSLLPWTSYYDATR